MTSYRLFVKFEDGTEETVDVASYSNGLGALWVDLPNGEAWMWAWHTIKSVRAIAIDATAPAPDGTDAVV